jgi:ornithine cyclodeaminase/alanine dehydrogenase-like protein (mu-crystallin family)
VEEGSTYVSGYLSGACALMSSSPSAPARRSARTSPSSSRSARPCPSCASRATALLLIVLAPAFPAVQFSFAAPGAPRRAEIAAADIILCATSARAPLMGGEERYVKPGAHVVVVGSYTREMHEVSGALLARAGGRLVVDSRKACLKEAGELIAAGRRGADLVEVGELVRLKEDGAWEADEERCADVRAKGDITVWKSVGVAVQDVAIAARVVARAEEIGLGTRVAGYDA